MALSRAVFLVGMMGSGKSTVGPLLAAALEVPFVDLDARVESEAEATVAEIFAAEGEAGFRAREARALAALAGEGPLVAAVGGGAPAHGDNLKTMQRAGTVVALTATVDELIARVGDTRTRPLLAGDGRGARAALERLLAARAAIYAQADLTVDTTGLPPSQVAARVRRALEGQTEGRAC